MAYFRSREPVARLGEAPPTASCDTTSPTEIIRAFEFDRHGVPASERVKIEALAREIMAGRVGKLRIVGHTDLVGDDAYNQKLALDRAHAVLQALRRIVRHVPLDFSLESRGESCPLVPGTHESARRQNRRVEIFVTPPPPKPRPIPPPQPKRPSIGPLPLPIVRPVSCMGGNIGCKTLAFIRARQAKRGALTPDEETQAIDIEHKLLMDNPDPANMPPLSAEKRFKWVQQQRERAERRVKRAIAGLF